MKICQSVINGRKGGRPNSEQYIAKFSIPGITLVVLTENQYNILLSRYGDAILQKAIQILEDWLKTSRVAIKYKGKNNYAHFRSDGWVINEAKNSSIPQT